MLEFRTRWLAHTDMGGTHGAVVELTIPPGQGYDSHRLEGNERVVYVYSGEGEHVGSGGPLAVEEDDVLVLAPEAWHGFRNRRNSDAVVWVAWAPDPVFDEAKYQRLPSGEPADGPAPIKRKLRSAGEDPSVTTEEMGFRSVGIVWDGAKGAQAITLGWAEFEADGTHEMHRHTGADEVLHAKSGTGKHLTPDGSSEMAAPAYEFAPAGEWHCMQVESGVKGMFWYLGAADLEGTGYELQADQASHG